MDHAFNAPFSQFAKSFMHLIQRKITLTTTGVKVKVDTVIGDDCFEAKQKDRELVEKR